MNLYVIGYRGSGKSTVAPLVAQLLGWDSVDSDDVIESKAGTSIAEIFSEHGERAFRKMETETILRLSNLENQVVSLGGGAPIEPENRPLLAGTGKTVWLKAATNLLWQRISGDASTGTRRPALTDQDGYSEVEQLLAERSPVYEACADYTIDIAALSPQEIADQIVKWFSSVDK